ncbi:hypothetical protein HZU75_08370 [Chitinibacter fontanus]|uniref:Uncharacterized protein n=1 Tax=Chitinibacter fontanus TaxID=1737446 RepID=A0A7D5Z3C4_9NEIS|nr:hypothetical protein [Chitinibacter fontanus]QLI81541.1 hypothetical protein HZU75_08370 [Chitinibacter fontanus]
MSFNYANAIYQELLSVYPDAMQSISTISKNTSDDREFILSDEIAFNFDIITNQAPAHPNCKEKTPDALFCKDDILYFVEFKEAKADKHDIRLKIHEAVIALYHFASNRGIIDKENFIKLKIRYAIIMRSPITKGTPHPSILNTLELTSTHFNLKNMEGFLIEKTKVAFVGASILDLLSNISSGTIKSIQLKSPDQTTVEQFILNPQ